MCIRDRYRLFVSLKQAIITWKPRLKDSYCLYRCMSPLALKSTPPLEMPYRKKKIDSFDVVIQMPKSPPHKRFLVGFTSPFMRHAEYPHGPWRLVLAMSAWSVKTRRAPSRQCRDARVYGHATTAMQGNEYTLRLLPLLRLLPATMLACAAPG